MMRQKTVPSSSRYCVEDNLEQRPPMGLRCRERQRQEVLKHSFPMTTTIRKSSQQVRLCLHKVTGKQLTVNHCLKAAPWLHRRDSVAQSIPAVLESPSKVPSNAHGMHLLVELAVPAVQVTKNNMSTQPNGCGGQGSHIREG